MASSDLGFRPPSQAQLALALTIVKSKPSNLSIRDYILSIRQYIRQGRSPQDSATEHKHLDSVAFWRQAYEKSESTQTKLLDKIYELEQRNENLLSRLNQSSPSEIVHLAKRKAKSDGGVGALPNCKRAKTANLAKSDRSTPSRAGLAGAVLPDFEIEEGPTATLLRQFHTLQKVLQRKLDPEALIVALIGLCKAAETAVRTVSSNSKGDHRNYDTSSRLSTHPLPTVLRVLGECYALIIRGLRKLCNSEGGNGVGPVVYHLVQVFRAVLARLHRYSLSKTQAALAEERLPRKKPKQRSKTKSAREASDGSSKDDATMTSFGQLIITMVISLDLSNGEQRDILEGFLCFFLEHVGRILGVFVFKELRSNPDLRVDAAKLPVPASISETPPEGINMTIAQKAAELESKYLVWALEKALGHVNKFRDSEETPEQVAQTLPLADRARTKLQNTLLKGVFGLDDPELGDSLKASIMPPVLPRPPLPKTEISEWFSQELWRLLGWDVLLRSC